MSIKSNFITWAKGYQYDIEQDPSIEDMFESIVTQRAWVVWQCAALCYKSPLVSEVED